MRPASARAGLLASRAAAREREAEATVPGRTEALTEAVHRAAAPTTSYNFV